MWRTGPPRTHDITWGPKINSFKRGAERYPQFGRDPSMQASVHRQDAAALLTKNLRGRTSGQDGGIGRHTVPPRTSKRRMTTI